MLEEYQLIKRNTQQSMNEAVYAIKMLQKGMVGEAEKQELVTEDAIEKLVKEVRMEVEGGNSCRQ